jgi:hypothetical protein
MDLLRQLRANGGKTVRPVGSKVPPSAEPAFVKRVANFARAAAKHAAAGRPQASDEQVAARWAVCQTNQCGLFQATGEGQGKCLHKSCGCNLKALGLKGLNKLRWADSKCPIGLWGAEC